MTVGESCRSRCLPPRVAYAAEYLTVEAAQRLLPRCPAFVPVTVTRLPMRARLAEVAQPPGARDPRVWRAMAGGKFLGTFYADWVIGKQEYIGFALALDAAGRVLKLDVLEYRKPMAGRFANGALARPIPGQDRRRSQCKSAATSQTFPARRFPVGT